MGVSPDKGVVDLNGEIFGHPNLFVADGSVVPGTWDYNLDVVHVALGLLQRQIKQEDQ